MTMAVGFESEEQFGHYRQLIAEPNHTRFAAEGNPLEVDHINEW